MIACEVEAFRLQWIQILVVELPDWTGYRDGFKELPAQQLN